MKVLNFDGTIYSARAGTAALPGISFANDTNTGIYSPGADQVAISTGGTGALFVDSSGRVGLGTSSAGDILHVKGGSTYAGVIADNSATTGGGAFRAYRNGVQKAIFCVDSWVTGTSSDDAAIYADAGGGIKFYTNNSSTAKAVLTSGGSLGIGTTAGVSYRKLTVKNDGSAGGIAVTNTNDDIVGQFCGENVGTSQELGIYSLSNMRLYTGGTQRATIDTSGRLLVGTSSDSGGALLQVNGDRVRIATAKTPATASDTGTAGEICWDANYIYVCTATNTWKRSAISTW